MTTTDPHRAPGPSMEETAARWKQIIIGDTSKTAQELAAGNAITIAEARREAMQNHDPTAADLCVELGEAADPYIYPNSSDRDENRMCDEVSDGKSNRVMRAFLARVEAKVCVERQATYDVPEVNHKRTGRIVTECLSKPVSAKEVCLFNLGQKLSRCAHEITIDSLEDIAGYAANLAALLAAELPVNGT